MTHWKIIAGKENEYYYLTITIINWLAVFISQKYFEIITSSLKYCQDKKELRIAGFVIMTNHLHLICAGTLNHPLSDTIRDFKQFTAKKIIEALRDEKRNEILSNFREAANEDSRGNEHKIMIEGNHPILVEDEYMFRNKLSYMHDNPVRKGFVSQAEHWLYSSARNYYFNDHTILKIKCIA